MYSWEIVKTMEKYNYNLPSNVYLDMTEKSPQIIRVTYNACNNRFEIQDNEGSYWQFEVHYEAAKCA